MRLTGGRGAMVLGTSNCGALTGESGRFGSPLAGLAMSVEPPALTYKPGDLAWVFPFEKV